MTSASQLGLFQASRPALQRRLPDITRGKHKGNPQSEEANRVIQPRKSAWYDVILAAARHNREAGITLSEFVDQWNREHRHDRPFHSIKLNDVSGRFSELSIEKPPRLVKLAENGKNVTRRNQRGGVFGVWILPEFAPKGDSNDAR